MIKDEDDEVSIICDLILISIRCKSEHGLRESKEMFCSGSYQSGKQPMVCVRAECGPGLV